MRLSGLSGKRRAMTLVEVVVVVAILGLLALLIPALWAEKRKAARMNCVSSLKEVGLAAKIWEGDHNDQYPESLSVTNGGAMELLATGNVAGYFQMMSNELATPKILVCPSDTEHIAAANFYPGLKNTNISYFVALNANDAYPQTILSGDDNLAVDGVPVTSGVMNLWNNHLVSWTDKRHHFAGNVLLVDGSVAQLGNAGLTSALDQPGSTTNIIVIP